jgi:hypothetical protein
MIAARLQFDGLPWQVEQQAAHAQLAEAHRPVP